MKKRITFLLSLMAMLFSFNTANAETVSPYAVDFNTTIDVSQHDFRVAPGWKHIVGKTSGWYSDSYMTYTYEATGGVDGTGCLYAGGQTTTQADILVTPKVSGTVSLAAEKRFTYSGTLTFYKVNEDENGNLTVGDEIEALGELEIYEWKTFTFTLDEATRVGIKAGELYLDNFQATSADVVLQPSVAFESVTCLSGTTVDVTSDGTFPVSFRVTVKNNGERDLAAGEATLTLGMRTVNSGDFQAEFTTVPVPQALAVGEVSDEIVVTANVPYADYPNRYQYGVRENLTGFISSTVQWIETVPYAPVLNVRYNGGNAESGLAVSYGMVSTDVTKEFTIQNQGAASMNVTAIDLPIGFTADVTAPFTLDAHSEQVVSVTLPASTPGIFSGDMVIKCEGLSDFTVALTGVVLDPTKWFADFNDEKMPAGSLFTNDWTTGYSTNYTPTAYYIQATKATTDMNLFITPLLHADAGEQMTFDVARRNTSTSEEYHLAVYYSTDRENWTLLRNILNTELSEEKASSSWGSSYYKFSTFAVTLPEAGDYYIGFSAGYVLLDNVYGLTPVAVQHDVQYTFGDQPATGMANHDLTLTATVMNPLAEAETATLKFLVNGEVAVQSEAIELTQHAQKTITLTYTPYVAGTYQTKLVLELADGTQFESAEQELVVAEEVASALAAVGNKDATTITQNAPFNTNWISSQAEMIYTADEIKLPVGTKITSLTFKGYRTSATNSAPIQIWFEETSDATAATSGTSFVEMSDETKVFDGNYEFKKAGSSSSFVEMVSITLPTPIIYNGGNLRVVAQSTSCNFGATNFQSYSGTTTYRRADAVLASLSSSFSSDYYKPVLYLGIEKAASTFSGVLTITDGEATEPVANTMVTLTSGNVKYMGTTDNEGAFKFNVLQDDKTYDITFDYSEKNYFPLAEADRTVTFNGQSVVKNINLTAAKDFFIDAFEVAQQGKVGRELTTSVTATNYNKATMAANAYTAKLYVAGQVVAEAETVALEEMEQHTFTFTWTPTEAGNLEAYMELAVAGSTTRTTEVKTIDIEAKHGISYDNVIPETGMVNSEFTATVKVKNTLREEEPEGSYVVKFFFGDEQVGEADGIALAVVSQSYTFTCTPHEAGQYTAYAVVEFNDGDSFKSDEVTVTVSEEVASSMKDVVAATTFVRGAPINAYFKITQSEMVYTAEQLGLQAGTKITSIGFKYYGTHSFPLDVYVANTTDEAPASTGATPVAFDDMKKVYSSANVTISGGSSSNPQTLVLDFSEPFTYDGGNLRIFVDQQKAGNYSSTTYFGVNSNYQGQTVFRYNDNSVASTSFSAAALPALSVGYEKSEVTTFSGKLDIYNVDGSQPAVAGATVKLVSDNVEYKGVTDEQGLFSIPVIKDDRTYTVTVEPVPGLLFLPFEETVTFAGESIVKNLTLTQAEGLYIANIEPEAKAMVNYEFNVSFEGTNYEATTQSDYAVQLYVNDELVAEAEPVALASGESHIFNLSYTPHVAGPATAHISMGDYDSDDFHFTVSDEVAMKEVQLGAATTTSNFVPFYWSYADDATGAFGDFYYTPALLEESGIKAGSKIYSITYTGRNTYDNGITKLTATAWVGLEAADAEWNAGETEGLTEVVLYDNESVTLGSSVETAIELPEPIVYDGTSRLRVSTFINANGKFATVQYDVDERGSETSCYGYGSNKNRGSGKGVPVATVLIDTENHLTGRITNGNNPVADAVVTLVCGDIIYTAETDADGNYDVTVLQNDKEYEMIVESETLGEAVAGTVSFADGNQVKDFDFNATSIVEVISRSKLNANAPMYNVSGQRVDASYKGIILQNGMKFRMK